MAENKTKPTNVDPEHYIAALENVTQREDGIWLMNLMSEIADAPAKMWGLSIIGFGDYHYKYASGREGDFFLAGFAPRKNQLVVYLNGQIHEQAGLLAKLGEHKMGKGCLYIKRLETIDRGVLKELIRKSIDGLRAAYPAL